MRADMRQPWFLFWLLLGLALVALLLNSSLPVSLAGHELVLGLGLALLLISAASFVYIRAQRRASGEPQWWQDDDWSHWGGI